MTSPQSNFLAASKMGIGAWAWGDRMFWGYGQGYQITDIEEAFRICLDAGVNFIDTAEVYGQGKSEVILGELLKKHQRRVFVATKFLPSPWFEKSFEKITDTTSTVQR